MIFSIFVFIFTFLHLHLHNLHLYFHLYYLHLIYCKHFSVVLVKELSAALLMIP